MGADTVRRTTAAFVALAIFAAVAVAEGPIAPAGTAIADHACMLGLGPKCFVPCGWSPGEHPMWYCD